MDERVLAPPLLVIGLVKKPNGDEQWLPTRIPIRNVTGIAIRRTRHRRTPISGIARNRWTIQGVAKVTS